MTLSIRVYRYDSETGEMVFLDAPNPGDELGGFEVTRTELWGSEVVQRLGPTMLPQLRQIYGVGAEPPEEFARMEYEALTILEHYKELAQAIQYDEDYVVKRVGNLVRAMERARAANAHVIIW